MKVIIAGGRHIMDPHVVEQAMEKFVAEYCPPIVPDYGPGDLGKPSEIVSGGATGVDEMGENWAKAHNIPVKVFPANWKLHGKAAGPIRNEVMGNYADALVACWDGASRGTGSMIGIMRTLNKIVFVWRV